MPILSGRTSFLGTGIVLGVESFLIVDMAIIHQLLRLHGILFSNYFEYGLLLVSILLMTRSLLTRKWNFHTFEIRCGILIGIGGTLFLDVVLVDEILKLHTVNYPALINIASGLVGLLLAMIGLYAYARSNKAIQQRNYARHISHHDENRHGRAWQTIILYGVLVRAQMFDYRLRQECARCQESIPIASR